MKNEKQAHCIAILGTCSDAGKSLTAAAICRILSDLGMRVAPFKTQNMSNNSFVTSEGGEIGRAQVVQAECARVEPTVDMNPVLLKPAGGSASQIIIRGKAEGNITSREFRNDRTLLFERAMESLDRLRSMNEVVVIEGAGSCAELNLNQYDIANFRTALYANANVILVADIERGGVFAQIIGTLNLLNAEERASVKGILINRFRGDISLFDEGVKIIEEKTGIPVLGVIPYDDGLNIDAEDTLSLTRKKGPIELLIEEAVNIAVLRLPHISNFTDFHPLETEEKVNVSYLTKPVPLDGLDLFIIPGSKNVRSDLLWIRESGWEQAILSYAERGGKILGICGGYQMLGNEITDSDGVEGAAGNAKGLGLLNVNTVMKTSKKLARVKGISLVDGSKVEGYEIHMGVTERAEEVKPFLKLDENVDGANSGNVFGCYLHGIFDSPQFMSSFLSLNESHQNSFNSEKQNKYDRLAALYKDNMDMEAVMEIAGLGKMMEAENAS